MLRLITILVLCGTVGPLWAQQGQLIHTAADVEDITTLLMQSTFRIYGPAANGNTTVGTVFIIGKSIKGQEPKAAYVLVTALHVFDGIVGDSATLSLRVKAPDKTYSIVPYNIKIRDKGKSLFVRHPEADVAAMYVQIPTSVGIPLLPIESIAEDKTIETLEIHPGDELLCLGYPFGLSVNDWGFPILRSGKISSYPITPSSLVKFIGFDFRVYGGNSGGPVFFKYENRTYEGHPHFGTNFGIIGLVSQQVQDPATRTDISLAHIVPGQFISETIKLLPEYKDN